MSNGFVAYDGPSMIDGVNVLGIVTWGSRNGKTGNMNQLWIIVRDRDPWEVLKAGDDESICGTCPLRAGEGCFVQVPQAPLSIWRAWRRGSYPLEWDHERLAKRSIRLGAYGDPAALPRDIVRRLVEASPLGWTGYTHQWREPRFRWLRDYCMASVQSLHETLQASRHGWRCYRMKHPEALRVYGIESHCPASKEMGEKLQCANCLFCSGLEGKGVGHVCINVHGSEFVVQQARRHVG